MKSHGRRIPRKISWSEAGRAWRLGVKTPDFLEVPFSDGYFKARNKGSGCVIVMNLPW